MKKLLLAAFLCLFSSVALAQIQDDRYPQQTAGLSQYQKKLKKQKVHYRTFIASRGEVIGGRPHGCPYRFCGCALALNIFGRIVPHLNLAANWLKFPRATPAPGMVAARHGHVFKLVSHQSGSVWTVWDANSGGGRIRVHSRSIAGYAVVNPQRG